MGCRAAGLRVSQYTLIPYTARDARTLVGYWVLGKWFFL